MADMDDDIEQLQAEMPEPAQKVVRNIMDEPIPGAVKQRLLKPLLPGKPRTSPTSHTQGPEEEGHLGGV